MKKERGNFRYPVPNYSIPCLSRPTFRQLSANFFFLGLLLTPDSVKYFLQGCTPNLSHALSRVHLLCLPENLYGNLSP